MESRIEYQDPDDRSESGPKQQITSSAEHDSAPKPSFCDLLFGKHLGNYYKNVYLTNPNGFNSSTPNPGMWEAYVYKSADSTRSVVKDGRIIRENFIRSLVNLGTHVTKTETDLSQTILNRIHDRVSGEEQAIFDTFFNIVTKPESLGGTKSVTSAYINVQDAEKIEATSINTAEFKRLGKDQIIGYRVNVKTLKEGLDTPDAFLKNIKRDLRGGALNKKIALFTLYLPLILETDSIGNNSEVNLFGNKFIEPIFEIIKMQKKDSNMGGGLKGGDNSNRKAILRTLCEIIYEGNEEFKHLLTMALNDDEEVVSDQVIAEYLACNSAKSRLATPVSNIATLTALPQNTWRRLSDDSYEQLTPQGYKPLSKEECDKILNGTCAGSSIKEGVCEKFMNAVNNNNAVELVKLLAIPEIWVSNTAAESLNKLHPATVIRILNALHFGTKNGPFGKRVCSVEEWMKECIKDTNLQNAVLSDNVKAYLQHLVNFVNSNPSLIDPSKRPIAAMTSAATPDALKIRGLFYAGEALSHGSSAPLNFSQVRQAVSATCGAVNLSSVHVPYATAFGAVQLGGQKGGNHLYTQSSQAQLSLGSGIQALLSQVLSGLKSTQYGLSAEDEAKINQKVTNLTALEQEIYATIMDLNEKRLALQCGANCHSQVASTQERLMQLSSTYDRKAPCLQELCEQLRMLLAQQQNTAGCQPIQ
jgi:hypothetical protein